MKEKDLDLLQEQLLFADGDVHIGFSASPFDQNAWRQSLNVVAVADRLWLEQHPECQVRRRLIHPIEMQMTGDPAGTEVHVVRGPQGSQIRYFLLPE